MQVYAIYTQKRDVTRRLESILAKEGIRVAVLITQVVPEEREAGTNASCAPAFRWSWDIHASHRLG